MATVIRTRLVKIGNSQGIRIPKVILDQLGLLDNIELEIHDDQLVVRSSKTSRAGWEAAFQQMSQHGDDNLLDDPVIATTWDSTEWEW